MSWLTDPFRYEFMRTALAAGILTAVICSLVGVWVVIRGLTFIGDALAHGVMPGIALAFLVGFDITVGAFLSALVMAGGITLVNRKSRLAEDTGIGLLFVGMLALGVIIISKARSFQGELTSFLFGDILGVTASDLVVQQVAAVAVLAVVVVLYRPFLALSFNQDKAAVLGMRPRLAHAVLLALVAVAIVVSFRTVGTLLVFGLLVAPPATASLLVRRVPLLLVVSPLVGSLAVVVGLEISYHFGTAGGATIAGVAVALFFTVLLVRELTTAARDRRPAIPRGAPA